MVDLCHPIQLIPEVEDEGEWILISRYMRMNFQENG